MGKMFCPRCKSTNVSKEINTLLVIGVPQQWKCNDCGYTNFIFPEKTEKKKIKNIKRRKKK